MKIEKGMKVKVENNEIFGYMGLTVVTGTVFNVNADSFSIQCDQTRAIEIVDNNDGKITVLS